MKKYEELVKDTEEKYNKVIKNAEGKDYIYVHSRQVFKQMIKGDIYCVDDFAYTFRGVRDDKPHTIFVFAKTDRVLAMFHDAFVDNYVSQNTEKKEG